MGFKVTSSVLRKPINRARNLNANMVKGCENLIKELETVGADTANQLIASAYVDLGLDHTAIKPDLSIEHNSSNDADGAHCTVSMVGADAPFVEFGAGVKVNSGRTYPGERPAGVVDLGQYGKGHGNRKVWGFYMDGSKDSLYLTLGTPMQHPMYDTSKAMRAKITKEHFKELMDK